MTQVCKVRQSLRLVPAIIYNGAHSPTRTDSLLACASVRDPFVCVYNVLRAIRNQDPRLGGYAQGW